MTPQTLDDELGQALITAASAAPSLHNCQPWQFHFDRATRTINVHALPQRAPLLTDPDTRALHISAGAALANLQATAVHLGREPVVRLLPRPEKPDLLATVRLAGPPRAALLRRPDLYQAIWHRRSSRLPFSAEPVPAAVLAELAEAARLDGADLHRPGPSERRTLLDLTARAEHRNLRHPGRHAENLAALATPGSRAGIPAYALGPQDSTGRVPLRTFAGPADGLSRERAPFEADPQLLLLTTRHDHRADWLRAGQALQHVLLVLTLHGLRASILYQALEWPDLRAQLADPEHGRCAPQMLLRIGYGPAGCPTPRLRAEPPQSQSQSQSHDATLAAAPLAGSVRP
ncbi:Acg family FMN-binding oxidoreductase [Kitasatospora sp. NPDC101155]|uniref:Acg family FMN-binding oxidoreductase n=1 Tax=Kitasatospora sp. NPDC101155 TaxID=3364097 RepID=UPI003816E2B5